MTRLAFTVLLFLCSCTSQGQSNDRFLIDCWGAVKVGENVYRMSFEAISFPVTEGGIFSRSRRCRNARIQFVSLPPPADERLRQLEDRYSDPARLGVGFRGVAHVSPVERVNEHYLKVMVTEIVPMEAMSPAETDAFIKQHRIG